MALPKRKVVFQPSFFTGDRCPAFPKKLFSRACSIMHPFKNTSSTPTQSRDQKDTTFVFRIHIRCLFVFTHRHEVLSKCPVLLFQPIELEIEITGITGVRQKNPERFMCLKTWEINKAHCIKKGACLRLMIWLPSFFQSSHQGGAFFLAEKIDVRELVWSLSVHMGVSKNHVFFQNGWFIRAQPYFLMDDFGGKPQFLETPTWKLIQLKIRSYRSSCLG